MNEINDNKSTKFCQNCGAEIDRRAEICPKCGVRVELPPSVNPVIKNPGIAAVLSFFIPGLGQIYNGQIGKGILFIITGVILALMIIIVIGIILYPIFWIYNIYDSYTTAQKINTGEIQPE